MTQFDDLLMYLRYLIRKLNVLKNIGNVRGRCWFSAPALESQRAM